MMSKRKSNIRTDGMTEKQDTNHTKIQIKKKTTNNMKERKHHWIKIMKVKNKNKNQEKRIKINMNLATYIIFP